MQINEIHQLDDNQPVHPSKAKLDKIRGSGGPYSLHATSQCLLFPTSHQSSLIYDWSLHDQPLRSDTKWQPVLKNTLYMLAKILLIFTLKS